MIHRHGLSLSKLLKHSVLALHHQWAVGQELLVGRNNLKKDQSREKCN